MTFASIAADARAEIYAEMGVIAAWTPAAGPGDEVAGKYRAPYAEAGFGGVSVGGDRPTFEAAIAVACAKGDQLAIPGQGDFEIIHRKDDPGTGLAVLVLEAL